MRISSIKIENFLPIKRFEVEGLSDLVVIAGPNGVGKTRLVNRILAAFQGSGENIDLVIEATSQEEIDIFGKRSISTLENGIDSIRGVLRTNKSRRNFKSGILYFESGRSIQNVNALSFQFDFEDPYMESIKWDLPMKGLAGRWQDTQHAIFKKIQSQKTAIANKAIELRNQGHGSMNLQFSDPLEPFRDAFFKLLGPKRLIRADLSSQHLMYEEDGEERRIDTLSSGEREVLNITFDFLLRNPSDCIVFFDEPEVHLHPELLIKMVSTLRSIGKNNQFFFFSHSPDLVSSSLEDSVIFLTPRKAEDQNQAILVKPGDDATRAMHQLGHSVGVLSLGRKIVVIEGNDASLDKRTYSQILANRFPELVLVPGGGRRTVENFGNLVTGVLDKAVWGVEFFMLTDRDSGIANTGSPNSRQLPRYHLENYFLDAGVLASCFEAIEDKDSWLRNVDEIEKFLSATALEKLGYAVALKVSHEVRQQCGNVSIMPSGVHGLGKSDLIDALVSKALSERNRNQEFLDPEKVKTLTSDTYDKFSDLVHSQNLVWKDDIPGKPILAVFCGKSGLNVGRLKNLYMKAADESSSDTFSDIIEIFGGFAQASALPISVPFE
jgi:hypothetical protein